MNTVRYLPGKMLFLYLTNGCACMIRKSITCAAFIPILHTIDTENKHSNIFNFIRKGT